MSDTKDRRARQWTFIAYPDSAPDGWQDWLASQGISALISPLHDKDVNPDKTPKKPHWHVMLSFKGMKSYKQVLEIAKGTIHGTIPEVLRGDGTGMARYFLHLDNPEKHRYSEADLRSIGDVDIAQLLKPSITDRQTVLDQIFDYIITHNISNFNVLYGCAKRLKKTQWLTVMCTTNTLVITKMLDGQYQLKQQGVSKESLSKMVDDVLNQGGN